MSETTDHKRLLTILGAPAEVQQWADAFVASARTGTGDWPHPHPTMPMTAVPLATFARCVEKNLGEAWWITAPDSPERTPAPVPPDPDSGSAYHNLLHNILGDFH
jgi:hypothetical protein